MNLFPDLSAFFFGTLTHYNMKTLKLIATGIVFFLLLMMGAVGDSDPRRVIVFLPFAVLFFWAGDAFKKLWHTPKE